MNDSKLLDQFNSDLTQAAKSRDTETLKVLRFVKASIDAAQKVKGEALADAEVEKLIGKKIKQSQDAIAQFQKGNRPDLVKNEEREIAILFRYMPQQMDRQELEKIIDSAIKDSGATSLKDIGLVIGPVMKRVSGKADGKLVKEIIEAKLKSEINN